MKQTLELSLRDQSHVIKAMEVLYLIVPDGHTPRFEQVMNLTKSYSTEYDSEEMNYIFAALSYYSEIIFYLDSNLSIELVELAGYFKLSREQFQLEHHPLKQSHKEEAK